MSWVRDLYYTPLIETDRCAYSQFIAAIRSHCNNGAGFDLFAGRAGSADGQQYNGRIDHVGCCAHSTAPCLVTASTDASLGAAGVGSISVDQHGVVDSCSNGQDGDGLCVGGLSVGGSDNIDGGTHRCFCVDAVSYGCGCDSANRDGGLGKTLSENCSKGFGGGKRGPNWERNNAARIRRKMQRSAKRVEMSRNWRDRGSEGVLSEDVALKKSFFSECDEQVRKDLRDSRAKMLIAKNKRLEAEESGKLERMQSVEGVVAELVRVTKMASQLKRQTTDSKIGGWAETVADTLARSVAESAPSSVPSLESVGYGKSALMSSDGTFSDSDRLADYNRRVAILDDTFSGIGGYSEDDYEFALAKLKKEFSDVAFTPVQQAESQVCSKLMSVMFSCGIEAKKMVEVMEEMGHPVC